MKKKYVSEIKATRVKDYVPLKFWWMLDTDDKGIALFLPINFSMKKINLKAICEIVLNP